MKDKYVFYIIYDPAMKRIGRDINVHYISCVKLVWLYVPVFVVLDKFTYSLMFIKGPANCDFFIECDFVVFTHEHLIYFWSFLDRNRCCFAVVGVVFVVVFFLERGEGIGVRWLFQEGGIYKIIFRGGGYV